MWILFALTAASSFASMFLVLTYASRSGVPPAVSLFYVFVFGLLCSGGNLLLSGHDPRVTSRMVMLLVGAGFLSYLGNIVQLKAMGMAGNPGYVAGLVGCSSLILSLASVLLFGAELTGTKVAGMICVVVGAALVAL